MKTPLALETEKRIKKSYPNLIPFYQEYLGNFQMTLNEFDENYSDVIRWIEEHEDYFILPQDGLYYLTNYND